MWTRRHALFVDWIDLFRSGSSYHVTLNYQVGFRLTAGMRVLDAPPHMTGYGISSEGREREGRYHLSFNAKSGSQYERCLTDLERFVVDQCEPWFQRFRTVESLLTDLETPLNDAEREALFAAHAGISDPERVAASLAQGLASRRSVRRRRRREALQAASGW